MITFEPLWTTMDKKEVTGYALINKHGISRSLWHKLRHDKNVNLETINRLCEILECDVADIVKHIPDVK
ncbi:MAG: helix-turn-helix transcriptional regulator [Eubacterium sp.]|nr:helix-turn-helix transcriptional regulator [Eubacterium sp.]